MDYHFGETLETITGHGGRGQVLCDNGETIVVVNPFVFDETDAVPTPSNIKEGCYVFVIKAMGNWTIIAGGCD